MMTRAFVVVCVFAAGIRTAAADESANELATAAGEAFVAGDLAKAAGLYERAYELDHHALYLFAAGKFRYELGDCPAAIKLLERFTAANTNEQVGQTKAIVDACKRKLEAAAQRLQTRSELVTSVRAAVAAGDCRVAAALQARWSELEDRSDQKRRVADLVVACRPSVSIVRLRTPWHRRRVVLGGMIGGALIGLGGGTLLWLGDRAARDATAAGDAGEPLSTVVDHAQTAHDRRLAGGLVLSGGGLVVAASYVLHRWFPEWQELEIRTKPGEIGMSWSTRF
jgi:tetratricopeptide (TPR) repeat protein